jgi:hypothetical protein
MMKKISEVLKINKKWIFLPVLLLVVILFLGVSSSSYKQTKKDTSTEASSQPLSNIEAVDLTKIRIFLAKYKDKIDDLNEKQKSLEKQNLNLKKELKTIKTRVNNLPKAIKIQKPELESSEKTKKGLHVNLPVGITKITVLKNPLKRKLVLPAGTQIKAKLLTGIYAPIDNEPLPVLAKVISFAKGPNSTFIPVVGAYLIGKAEGEANSSRAVVQFVKLSLVKNSGQTLTCDINAFARDEDDKIFGIKGQYVYHVEDKVFLSFLSGFAKGQAEAYALSKIVLSNFQYTQQAQIKDPQKFATYKGMASALSKIDEIIQKRVSEFTPAIKVNSGRIITVVLLEKVILGDYDEKNFNICCYR